MPRRALPALLTAAAAAALVGAAPAYADEGCDLRVPPRITVQHARTVLHGAVSGSCRREDGYAGWEMWKDGGDRARSTYVFYDQTTDGATATLDLYGTDLEWGRHTLHPAGAGGSCTEATDFEDCAVPQNAPRTDVRLGSSSAVSGRRARRAVTLTGASAVYSPTADRFVRRSAPGQFQWRSRGGAWHRLRSVTTNRAGLATVRARAPRGRQYRFVTTTAAQWWSSASGVVTR